MTIPRLAWATLTIPPASQLNSAASSADDRQISAAGSRSVVPLTYGTDRIGGLLLNVLPKAGDATKLLVQLLWGFAGSGVASVQLNGLDLPGTATVTTYLGSQTAADTALVAAFAAQSITYADTLQGFAYSVVEIAQSAIGSELQFTSLFAGALLYDPRLDSTVAGGSGSNRLATPSTWTGAPDCPALALGNFLASTAYGASETVDWVGVSAAANANDATVGSPPEKRRTIGVTFISPSSVADVAEALRAYAGCFLIPGASGIKLLPDADGSAVATYSHTDGTIASITALQMRDLGNSPTSVEIIYTDTTVVPWRDASAFADLPGAGTTLPYRLSQVRMPGVKRYSQARREAIERLNKLTLQDLSTQIEVFDVGIRHQIGDIVAVTHPIGITNKLFRVTLPESPAAGRWVLPLIEHDPACYSSVVETVPTYANSGALISNASSSPGFYALAITVYQRAASLPSVPLGGSYTFTGDIFVAPSGWSRNIPAVDGNPAWASTWLFEATTPTVAVAGPTSSFTAPTGAFPDSSVGDPLFANVTLLLHFEGANNSTTTTDSSSYARTISTFLGTAKLTTSSPITGTSSLLLDGTTASGVPVPYATEISFSGVDFVLEGRCTRTSSTGFVNLLDFRGSGPLFGAGSSWVLNFNASTGAIGIFDGPTNAGVMTSATGVVPTGTAFYWAVQRSGGVVYIVVNGSPVASATYNPPATHSSGLYIGYSPSPSVGLAARMDEVRFTRGATRYNFTGWPTPTKFVQDGAAGSGGLSVYTASVYKQASSAPSTPTGGSYTFSTGVLTPPIGWTVAQPASTATPTYVAEYYFSTSTPATAVTAGTWTTPVIDAVASLGISILTMEIYQQASSAPSAPTGGSYTFSSDSFTPPSGWTRGQPASTTTPTYRAAYTFTTTTPSVAVTGGTWSTPFVAAQNGADGANGLSGVVVLAYQRSTSGAPTLPSATTTYTFATAALTGLNNGWTATIPSGTDALYVTAATARSSGATDTIAASEWSSAELMSASGLNNAAVVLYKRTTTSTAPSSVSASVTYTFSSGIASGLTNGWTQELPATGGAWRWVINATALSAGATDTILTSEWSAVALLAEDGDPGSDAYVLRLDNDNVTVPADSTGFVTSYSAARTAASVIKGGTSDDTSAWTITKTDGANITSNLSGTTVQVTSLTADIGIVNVSAARTGFVTMTAKFTVSRARSATTASGVLSGGYYSFAIDYIPPNGIGAFFGSDGTVKGGDSSVAYPTVGNWYAPTTSGIGATHWIRVVPRSGADTLTTGTINSWVALSAGQGWTYDVAAFGAAKSGIFDYEISASSTGIPVLGSGVIDLSAGNGA